jgi:hypothetical protein
MDAFLGHSPYSRHPATGIHALGNLPNVPQGLELLVSTPNGHTDIQRSYDAMSKSQKKIFQPFVKDLLNGDPVLQTTVCTTLYSDPHHNTTRARNRIMQALPLMRVPMYMLSYGGVGKKAVGRWHSMFIPIPEFGNTTNPRDSSWQQGARIYAFTNFVEPVTGRLTDDIKANAVLLWKKQIKVFQSSCCRRFAQRHLLQECKSVSGDLAVLHILKLQERGLWFCQHVITPPY